MLRSILRSARPAMRLLAAIAVVFWAPAALQAQDASLKKADAFFELEDYHTAVTQYEQILKENPESGISKFKAGVCYLYIGKAAQGLSYIRQAQKMPLENDPYYYFWLGKAYHLNMRIDSALVNYRRYLNEAPGTDAFRKGTETLIAQAHRTESYFVHSDASPLQARNAGENINSPYTERNPMVTADGKTMVFASRRPIYPEEQPLADGEYIEKSFISRQLPGGGWGKAEPLLAPADRRNWYTAVQLIDGGQGILLFQEGKEGGYFSAPRQGDGFGLPQRLELGLKGSATGYDVTFAADLKSAIYSHLNRTTGDLDLYYIWKEGNGGWSKATRLAATTNTLENEFSPMLAANGKTLYFASKGRDGMGGFDLYSSHWDEATARWAPAENMGLPYNSPGSDISYSEVTIDGKRTGLLCAARPKGFGEADIYEIDFTGVQANSGF